MSPLFCNDTICKRSYKIRISNRWQTMSNNKRSPSFPDLKERNDGPTLALSGTCDTSTLHIRVEQNILTFSLEMVF